MKNEQEKTPFFDAILKYIEKDRAALHMPGHMRGGGIHSKLKDFWGKNVFLTDLTEVEGLDYLHKPTGVLKEAQELAAKAYGAKASFFLVNGSTVGNQAMVLSQTKPRDKIIVQRNSHRSLFGALILGVLEPIYLKPMEDKVLKFQTFPKKEDFETVLKKYPKVKAVFLTSPNYFGITGNIKYFIDKTHKEGRLALVDEAHGSHFHFNPKLPESAIDLEADMVIQSTHKTLAGLTQTSMLHVGTRAIDLEHLRTTLTILETSSPSYLFMTALDVSRMQMATKGKELLNRTIELAEHARKEINKIDGLIALTREMAKEDEAVYDLDLTKLTVNVEGLGLTGFEVEHLLNSKYNVEIELSDLYNILGFITIGSQKEDVEKFIYAIKDIAKNYKKKKVKIPHLSIPEIPPMAMIPHEAYHLPKDIVRIEEAKGRICGELITPYPPGIPIIAPGEIIEKEIVEYLVYTRDKGADLQGLKDKEAKLVEVIKE